MCTFTSLNSCFNSSSFRRVSLLRLRSTFFTIFSSNVYTNIKLSTEECKFTIQICTAKADN